MQKQRTDELVYPNTSSFQLMNVYCQLFRAFGGRTDSVCACCQASTFGILNASRFEVEYERWVFQGGVEKLVQLRILGNCKEGRRCFEQSPN